MVRDITLGQYVIAKSPLHRVDPRIKLIGLIFVIAFLFVADNFVGLGCMAALVLQYLKSLRAVIVLVLFTSLFNLFYGSGTVLVQWGVMQITDGGIKNAIFVAARILTMILASSVLTFTTSPNQLSDGMERLMKPLSYIKVPVHEIAMMMTIAIRFIPTMLEETNKIMSKSLGAGADSAVPILLPQSL